VTGKELQDPRQNHATYIIYLYTYTYIPFIPEPPQFRGAAFYAATKIFPHILPFNDLLTNGFI
jgi:hypothetical protein